MISCFIFKVDCLGAMKQKKICNRCNFQKPLVRFNEGHNDCRDCQARDAAARRDRIKVFLRKLKAFTACIHCGLRDWRLIDFHHISPDSKSFDLSGAAKKRVCLATLKRELRKCIPVCLHCHRIIHIECVL
jgi:hypothetical protein